MFWRDTQEGSWQTCVCLILEIRVCISTYLFWQARFLIGYKIFLPYSLHHQFDDLSHFSQCLMSLAFLFVREFVYKPVLFQSIQRIKMLFFTDVSLYKESCSISSLFFFPLYHILVLCFGQEYIIFGDILPSASQSFLSQRLLWESN